ncbi:MAG: 4-hydroxy-tetrahydrodipicolinate synthase [Proteobacteria bacterium]|nr:4-hydroxy-tetrahydrodipicolinate synthase [Pseudomonadota bacterium]
MFKGTYTALITPFRKDLSIDEGALRRIVNFQIENGISGLVPVGTTGESPTTTPDEDKRIYQIVVEEADGRVPVICGSGSNSTAEAVTYTRNAKEAGADAALIVCPYYNKPTPMGLVQHYRKIADEGGLPIIVYNIEGRTGVNIETDTLMEIAQHPNVVGVKEASGDLDQMKEVIERSADDFSVLSGDDSLALDLVKMGGQGVISVASQVMPRQVSVYIAHALAGDLQRAENEKEELDELFDSMFIETNPIPVKTALALMGICRERFRLPLCEMEEKNKHKLIATLRRYQLIEG